MLIILSANSSPADWVSILPYITSLHSSLRVRALVCISVCEHACVFIALIFPNHFPLPPVSEAMFQAMRFAGDVE